MRMAFSRFEDRDRTKGRARHASAAPRMRVECPTCPSARTSASRRPSTRGIPRPQDVAREVARLVASACSIAVVEHIGSHVGAGPAGQELRRPRHRGGPRRHPGDQRGDPLARLRPPAGRRPVPADAAHVHGLGRPRRDVATRSISTSCPRPAGSWPSSSRSATRCARTTRSATRTPRRSGGSSTRRPTARRTACTRSRKGDFVLDALYRLGIRQAAGRRARSRCAPGSTIGIMGGGQLGRMLALAARAMGYRIVALDPDPGCPTASVADELIVGRYDDVDAARRLGALSDVVTYELEHVGIEAAAAAGRGERRCDPGSRALARHAGPARRAALHPRDRGVHRAVARGPRDRGGRGGRGRPRLPVPAQAPARRVRRPQPGPDRVARRRRGRGRLARRCGRAAAAARGARSTSRASCRASSPATATDARSRSRRPRTSTTQGSSPRASRPPPSTRCSAYDAMEIAERLARSLDLVGLLTVELFRLRGGGLMINELAPRVHNSRPLDDRGGGDLTVRAAAAGDPRPAAGVRGTARRDGDGQPPGHGARIATRTSPACPTRSRIPAPTSTSTASGVSSNAARWGT